MQRRTVQDEESQPGSDSESAPDEGPVQRELDANGNVSIVVASAGDRPANPEAASTVSCLNTSVWQKTWLVQGPYWLYALLSSAPTAFSVMLNEKRILPSRIENLDHFRELWRQSDAQEWKVYVSGLDSGLVNLLFNLKFLDPAVRRSIRYTRELKNASARDRAIYAIAVLLAIGGGVTFGAIGFVSFEFAGPALASLFFLLNFSAYAAPRVASIFDLFEAWFSHEVALKERLVTILRAIPDEDFARLPVMQTIDQPTVAFQRQLVKELFQWSLDHADALQALAGKRQVVNLFSIGVTVTLLWPVLAPYAQRGLKGLEIIFHLAKDPARYTSPALIGGYFMSMSSYLFYLRLFYKMPWVFGDQALYVFKRFFAKSWRAMPAALKVLAVTLMCGFATGGMQNVFEDTFAAGYTSYFPLMGPLYRLWDWVTWVNGIVINLSPILCLLLDWASQVYDPRELTRQLLLLKTEYAGLLSGELSSAVLADFIAEFAPSASAEELGVDGAGSEDSDDGLLDLDHDFLVRALERVANAREDADDEEDDDEQAALLAAEEEEGDRPSLDNARTLGEGLARHGLWQQGAGDLRHRPTASRPSLGATVSSSASPFTQADQAYARLLANKQRGGCCASLFRWLGSWCSSSSQSSTSSSSNPGALVDRRAAAAPGRGGHLA